jgi:hypothetical protein
MIKKIFFAAMLLSTTYVHASDAVIDVPALVGKSKSQVSGLIGQPTSCSSSKYGEKCQYEKAETEIVFINKKADWITVEGLDDKPFSDSTITFLGFKPQKPSFSNAFTMKWEPLQGLRSVSIYKGGANSDYAYIKAYTK